MEEYICIKRRNNEWNFVNYRQVKLWVVGNSIDCLTFDFSCWIVSRNALCSRGNFSILIER